MPKPINVDIVSCQEPFVKIELADGAILQVRLAVVGVQRLFNDDGTPTKREGDGGACYGLNAQTLVVCIKEPVDKASMS